MAQPMVQRAEPFRRKPPAEGVIASMMFRGTIVQNSEANIELRQRVQQRLQAMEHVRLSWWASWRELATFIQPRLGRFLQTPNEGGRGRPMNRRIIDSTGTTASQRFAAGLMAGVASPARPWFRLRIGRKPMAEGSDGAIWLAAVEEVLREVFAGSNFYRSLATLFEEIGVFGTGVMILYEDFKDVIRCFPLAAGEYYLALDDRLEPSVLGRKIVMTVAEMVGRFGLSNVTGGVAADYRAGRHDNEHLIGHLIQPNDSRAINAPGARGMPWVETYWEWADGANQLLEVKGYNERPFVASRWNVTGNDPYGRSCGMDAIGDVRQLQTTQKRSAQLVDKLVNPPLVAPSVLKNEPASVIPGAVTFLPNGAGDVSFKPVYEVKPEGLPAISKLIAETQQRVKTVFFEDLFLMIAQLDTVRSATEVVERKEEKMLMLGPALERQHDELLKVAVERAYAILVRHSRPLWARGLPAPLPAPPQEIAGKDITIDFISTLAQAQKATATVAIERMFSFVGSLSAVYPEARDKLDVDAGIDQYAEAIGTPPTIVVSAEKVAQIRKQRAQQQAGATALQTGMAAAQTGKVLADTPLGAGQTALGKITGLAA